MTWRSNNTGCKKIGRGSVGTGVDRGDEIELSKLIDILNERFGTEFKPGDRSAKMPWPTAACARQRLANKMENFGYVFSKALEGLFIDRMEQNEEITTAK